MEILWKMLTSRTQLHSQREFLVRSSDKLKTHWRLSWNSWNILLRIYAKLQPPGGMMEFLVFCLATDLSVQIGIHTEMYDAVENVVQCQIRTLWLEWRSKSFLKNNSKCEKLGSLSEIEGSELQTSFLSLPRLCKRRQWMQSPTGKGKIIRISSVSNHGAKEVYVATEAHLL